MFEDEPSSSSSKKYDLDEKRRSRRLQSIPAEKDGSEIDHPEYQHQNQTPEVKEENSKRQIKKSSAIRSRGRPPKGHSSTIRITQSKSTSSSTRGSKSKDQNSATGSKSSKSKESGLFSKRGRGIFVGHKGQPPIDSSEDGSNDSDNYDEDREAKCPVPGCDSSGHLSGKFDEHYSAITCPLFHNLSPRIVSIGLNAGQKDVRLT